MAILLVTILNIAYMTYLGEVKPHDSIFAHRLEIVNEALLQMITYHLTLSMILTGVANISINDALGWSLIVFVSILLTFNLLLVSMTSVKILRWRYHLRQLKKQN